jgi:hypothetical protein
MSRQLPDDNTALVAALGYSQLWFDNGLLTHELLVEQYHALNRSDDQHTEHYRYGTFRRYLNDRIHLTDNELTGYLQVALAEPDSVMGGAAAKDLFTEIDLTDQQFLKVCEKLVEFPGEWVAAICLRQRMLRQLAGSTPTAALFDECLMHGDSVVHKKLLQMADASQLATLATSGKTHAIRNMATQMLKADSR